MRALKAYHRRLAYRKLQQEDADWQAHAQRRRAPRRCLRCDEVFDSGGPQNRLCAACLKLIDLWGPMLE